MRSLRRIPASGPHGARRHRRAIGPDSRALVPLCAFVGGVAGLATGTALVMYVHAGRVAPIDGPMRRDELADVRVGMLAKGLPPVARVLVPAAGSGDVAPHEALGGTP